MTIWNAIMLGLVQGIAEFLPISSSGHLSLLCFDHFFDHIATYRSVLF